ILEGTSDGPAAQHFATQEIVESTYPDITVYPLPEWEDFYFSDGSRPSAASTEPPYYSEYGPAYPKGAQGNGAIPYFIMRSDWGPNAVWASVKMASEWWDDHQDYDAGTIAIKRDNDYLLVDASNWKGDAGSHGILGGSTEALDSASKNTLFFDDFGDYMYTDQNYCGGQGAWGIDQVVADEQNPDYTYARSDLSTAYNRASDPADQTNRRLISFYRNFLYLRAHGLFVVFDQVKAKSSGASRPPYEKHLRWHLPNHPTVAGAVTSMNQGASRLYLTTLLPSNAQFTVVDESNNSDPCEGNPSGCVPF